MKRADDQGFDVVAIAIDGGGTAIHCRLEGADGGTMRVVGGLALEQSPQTLDQALIGRTSRPVERLDSIVVAAQVEIDRDCVVGVPYPAPC